MEHLVAMSGDKNRRGQMSSNTKPTCDNKRHH